MVKASIAEVNSTHAIVTTCWLLFNVVQVLCPVAASVVCIALACASCCLSVFGGSLCLGSFV